MNSSVLFTFVCLLALHLVYSVPNQYGAGGAQFEIIDGNCTNPDAKNLVFKDNVHKTSIPFVKRSATTEWHGDQKIYCLMALSEKDQSKGSTVSLTEGGVNHTFVTLEMESGRGHGLEYNIKIYAK